MIRLTICFIAFFTTVASAQIGRDTFSIEISPASASVIERGYNVQGEVTYRPHRYLSVSMLYNQQLWATKYYSTYSLEPNPYRRNNFASATLGIILLQNGFFSTARPQPQPSKFHAYELQLDLGIFRSRYLAKHSEYYTYDSLPTGERQVISNINVTSLMTGLTFSAYVYSGRSFKYGDHAQWKRQYNFSLGSLYGLDYSLRGFTMIEGQYPSTTPPKSYAFWKSGYYGRFNFQQRLNTHFYAGFDAFIYKAPFVFYKPQYVYYVPRGGEYEYRLKIFAALTLGYHF